MDVMIVVTPILSAIVFAVGGLFKANEPLAVPKFVATIGVGAFIGLVCLMTGVQVTEQVVIAQLLIFGGAITIIEDVVKGFARRVA